MFLAETAGEVGLRDDISIDELEAMDASMRSESDEYGVRIETGGD